MCPSAFRLTKRANPLLQPTPGADSIPQPITSPLHDVFPVGKTPRRPRRLGQEGRDSTIGHSARQQSGVQSMTRIRFGRAAALAMIALCMGVINVSAQITTGTVAGTVKDAQGGVVPGATV